MLLDAISLLAGLLFHLTSITIVQDGRQMPLRLSFLRDISITGGADRAIFRREEERRGEEKETP